MAIVFGNTKFSNTNDELTNWLKRLLIAVEAVDKLLTGGFNKASRLLSITVEEELRNDAGIQNLASSAENCATSSRISRVKKTYLSFLEFQIAMIHQLITALLQQIP